MKKSLTVALVVLIGVNLLSIFLFTRFDLTRGDKYTISESSINLVKNLDKPVEVKAYVSADLPAQFLPLRQYLTDILLEYQAYAGGKFSFQFLDPMKDELLQKETVPLGIQPVRMQVREGDSLQVKLGYLGIGIFYGDKKEAIPLLQNEDLDHFEYTLSSLILKMSLPELPVIGLLTGHGEKDLAQTSRLVYQELQKNYHVKLLDLSQEKSLEGVSALVMAGPRKDISDAHLYALDQYFMRGGKGIFLIDAVEQDGQSVDHKPLDINIKDTFAPWGVTVPSHLVLDQSAEFGQFSEGPGRFYILPYPPFIRFSSKSLSDHPAVEKLQGFVMRFVSPLQIEQKEGIEVDSIVRTSTAAWKITPPFELNPSIIKAPDKSAMKSYPVLVELKGMLPRISKEVKGARGRTLAKPQGVSEVIIASDSDFITDASLQGDGSSGLLFLNLLDSLALGDQLISIRSKGVTNAPIRQLDDGTKFTLRVLGILLMPLIVTGYGMVRLVNRKKRC